MSLHALQCALAALFTEAGARDRFADDAAGFARAFGLDARECEQLEAMSAGAIASYAATLSRKRRGEAARFLTRTREVAGDEFARTFDAWAARTPPSPAAGRSRAARDAARFCAAFCSNRDLSGSEAAAVRLDRAEALRACRPARFRFFFRIGRGDLEDAQAER